MSTTSMFFDIFGRDKGVSEMFDKVQGKTKETTNVLQGLGAGIAGLGIAKMAGAAVSSFEEVGNAAFTLRQETGASAEDSSRLGYALSAVGLSAEDTAKPLGKFSKALVASGVDGAAHYKMLGDLGFQYQDTQGKLLPMTDLLPKLADRFKSMEDGPEKTALAMQLFGKSGADMIPFLNQGSDAMKEQMKASDDLGLTLSGSQVDAVHEAALAQKQWDNEMRGLLVTVGGALMPVLDGLKEMVRGQIAPAISGLVGWFKSLSPEMRQAVTVIGAMLLVGGPLVLVIGKFAGAFTQITGAVKTFKEVMLALNLVLAANPFILIIAGIALLVAGLIFAYNNVGWFKDFVDGAFKVISTVVSTVFEYISGTIVPNFQRSIGAIGAAIDGGVKWFNEFKDGVSKAIDGAIKFVEDIPGKVTGALRGAAGWLTQTGKDIIGGLIGGIQDTIGGISKTITDGVNGAIDAVKGVLGIHSPSTVMAEQVGAPMGQGVAVGVKSTFAGLRATMAGIKDITTGADFGINVDGSVSLAGGGTAVQSIRNTQPATQQQQPPIIHVYIGNEELDSRTVRIVGQGIGGANDYSGRRPSR